MIYLVIHDTLADKTLSFKFKPEIKLARIIEIFQSKYKHLEGKEITLRFNNQPLDSEWPISKVMKDFGLKDKGKLELGVRVDQALNDLDSMDFGDLDKLGDFSDGNMTVTPEVDIDNTPAPLPLKRPKNKLQEDEDEDIEVAEPAQPVSLEPEDSDDLFDPLSDSDLDMTPPKPVTPPPKAPATSAKMGTASISKPAPASLTSPTTKLPNTPTKGTSSLTKSKKKESDDFDPLADNNFSTQVPTANVVDEEKMEIELPNDSNVDLDLDSFSKLVPHKESPNNSVFDKNSSADETIDTDDSFDAIPAGEDSDNFLESLNEELFSTGGNQNAMSETQTPIPMEEQSLKPPAKKESTKALPKANTFKNTSTESVSKGYEEFDPLADSSLDLEESKPSKTFEKTEKENPFLQDTSEGFPTIDPDASGSSSKIVSADSSSDSIEDPFAPPAELPPMAPPPEDILSSPEEMPTEDSPLSDASEPSSEKSESISVSNSESSNAPSMVVAEEPVVSSVNASLDISSSSTSPKSTASESSATPVSEESKQLPERKTGLSGRYKRKVLARYFRQMHPLQNYPLFVALDKEDLKLSDIGKNPSISKGYGADQPWIEVIPNFPGCLVVPQRAMLNIQAPHTDCKFWITPLVADHLKESRVDLCYQNVVVQSVPLPTKINKKRVTQSFGLLTVLLPMIYPLFQSKGIDLLEMLPRHPEFQQWVEYLGGPVNFGICLGVLFFLLTMLSHFIQRPKENKPLQQFLDLQT